MKGNRFLATAWLAISALSFSLQATDISVDFSDYGSEHINNLAGSPGISADYSSIETDDEANETPGAATKPTPFSLDIYFDSISSAKIDRGFFKGDEVRYAEAAAELGMVFYHCAAYSEGANIALSYTNTYIHWSDNPWFDQDRFHTVTLSLGGVTKRLHNWFWRGQLNINYDIGSAFSADYFNYTLLAWGRYEYCKHIGLHVGFIAQTGMGMDRVYPILGADWQMSRNWKLNMVFPVNVSLEYILNKNWSLALAGRNFDSRHRVKKNEAHSKSVLRYQNIGAEFAIKYGSGTMTANLHAGTTLGGKYRIANRHNHDPHHYKLRPSGYAGGEIDVKF